MPLAQMIVDEDNRLVVLSTADGSGVSFSVYPERYPVEWQVVTLVDGEWQWGPAVADLDVGAVLAGDV